MRELIKFGKHLKGLHSSDLVFEMLDAKRHMKKCSLDDVIARFQIFLDGKAESFKVGITFNEGRRDMMRQIIEFKRGTI